MGMPLLDQAFVMWGGFVLNFFNRSFAGLYREKPQVNIDAPRRDVQGEWRIIGLRYRLRRADTRTALDTRNALWQYRETRGVTHDYPPLHETVADACNTRKPAQCN